MKRIDRWLVVFVLLVVLAACQTAAPEEGNGSSDTTAPQIVSITPADGATGVTKAAKIKIQFNEPMDIVSTQAAYSSDSDGIKPAQVTFTWEDAGKRLVITPNAPLAYSPDGSYKTYTFTLSTAASDRAGNPLATARSASFSTLRTLTSNLDPERIDGGVYFFYEEANGGEESYGAGSSGTKAFAGMTDTSVGDYYCNKAFFSFALSGLPEGTEEILAAKLGLFATLVGDTSSLSFALDHVDFGDELDEDDYNAPIYKTGEGTYASFGDGTVTQFDVGGWVQTSFAAGDDHFQVRVSMTTTCMSSLTDSTDGYDFETSESTNKPTLEVKYYAP